MRKNSCKIILLILFITGLSINYANAQATLDGSQSRIYLFDSSEVAEIAKIILENDMLRENEKSYAEKDSIFRAESNLYREKIQSLHEIIIFKEEQIRKFEAVPIMRGKSGWSWWQYTLAVIGAVCAGFTAGVIYGVSQ